MQTYFKWKTKQQNSSSGNRMDTNPVAGDDEHIDAKIFWPALKDYTRKSIEQCILIIRK